MLNTKLSLSVVLCALAVAVVAAQESETKRRHTTDELEQKYGVRPNAGTPKTKPTRFELLLEAERRGILTDDMKADLADLRSKRKKFLAEVRENEERFALFNNCQPIAPWIDLTNNEEKLGITESVVRNLAESRLRIARLRLREYPVGYSDSFASLTLKVRVSGSRSIIWVEYNKNVTDRFGQTGFVRTWHSSDILEYTNPDTITLILSLYLDEFLTEYLRINGEACGSRQMAR